MEIDLCVNMNPKVSVLMITYNQEQYIRPAIESVLVQQVNFSYELVIGEDCSNDRTREICQFYQRQHPDKIRLLVREKNLGMARNFLSALAVCKGEYLAILEGDDFWASPLKLQKQADFLDANPDYALVFGKTWAFFQDDNRLGYEIPPPDIKSYTLENLLHVNFIATCSVMYRRGLIKQYPNWLLHTEMLDWPMHLLYAQHGKIGFIDEPIARYRIHAKSNYSSRNVTRNFKGILEFYKTINRHFDYRYCKQIYRRQSWLCKEIASRSPSEGRWFGGMQYAVRVFYYYILSLLPRSILARIKAE